MEVDNFERLLCLKEVITQDSTWLKLFVKGRHVLFWESLGNSDSYYFQNHENTIEEVLQILLHVRKTF